jgi:ADP-ribosylglycohydrolase
MNGQSSITRENFRFDQSIIDETVKLADKKYSGHTAGCGPAQRSYPLAFCPFILDDDLFDYTKLEAQLTHYNPLAGEVAGIVNVICRSLVKNQSWTDAINSAFSTPQLHNDVKAIYGRHHRWSNPAVETHSAYAPTVLNAAIHYVATSENASQAIAKAHAKDKHYCTPIVGILAGARWGIPVEMFRDNINDTQLKTLRETANKLSDLWKIKPDSATA